METFNAMASKCKELIDKRRALEAETKAIKSEEDNLKGQLINYMCSNNISSTNYRDSFKIVLSEKSYLMVTDKDKFAEAILRALVCAYQEGRSFLDGLLVQLRPNKEAVLAYTVNHEGLQLVDLGLSLQKLPELSFRSNK